MVILFFCCGIETSVRLQGAGGGALPKAMQLVDVEMGALLASSQAGILSEERRCLGPLSG